MQKWKRVIQQLGLQFGASRWTTNTVNSLRFIFALGIHTFDYLNLTITSSNWWIPSKSKSKNAIVWSNNSGSNLVPPNVPSTLPNHRVSFLPAVPCKINWSTLLIIHNWPLSHQKHQFRQRQTAKMKTCDPTTRPPIKCLQMNNQHCQIMASHFCTSCTDKSIKPRLWQSKYTITSSKLPISTKTKTQKCKRMIQQFGLQPGAPTCTTNMTNSCLLTSALGTMYDQKTHFQSPKPTATQQNYQFRQKPNANMSTCDPTIWTPILCLQMCLQHG